MVISTSEAKYMTIIYDFKKALLLIDLLKQLSFIQCGFRLHRDTHSVNYLKNNQVYDTMTKHIIEKF